ncbi:MAG: hypothetical protein ACOX2O_07505 [Bdellovibrionota bacterium]|jgi:hypothetical protein
MLSIFFDLETTEENFVGQILNYCFITVDEEWERHSSLCGDIKISPLQLPHPAAILANRTNVIKHQDNPQALAEKDAMFEIANYISTVIEESKDRKVTLIGYNSTRFDIPYLRTSLIRNGFNPYFGGRIIYKDLLHTVRKVFCFDDTFPRTSAKEDSDLLSLSLQTITKSLKLLEGDQQHHSFADVELTIKLAHHLSHHFCCDVRTEETYLATKWQCGDLGVEIVPNYDLTTSERTVSHPVLLFDNDYRYALWIRLDKFKENPTRAAITWINKGQAAFFCRNDLVLDPEYIELAKKAQEDLKGITLKNFFEDSTCDIEQDIYRLDISGIDLLNKAIQSDDITPLREAPLKDAKILFLRYHLANYDWTIGEDERMHNMLQKYAHYRYGGSLQIKKIITDEKAEDNFYPTFEVLFAEIESVLNNPETTSADLELMTALKEYYLQSEIKKALER